MDAYEPLPSIGMALLLGLLIGFEREQSAPDDPAVRRRSFVGGARTYPLVSLVGALAALAVPHIGWALVVVAFAALCAFLGIAYYDEIKRGGERGLTSETAFLTTYLLGVLCTSTGVIEPSSRRLVVLASVAVIVTVILSMKPPMHSIAAKASKADIYATLKFLIVAIVVLPLLPNQTFGPLSVLNPFKIGLMVVLIAAIDFVGYVAVRVMGAGRGLGLTGIVGGLASSTALTLSMSHRVKEDSSLAPSCALAVVTASTVMVPRVLLEVSLVHRPLVAPLAWPLAGMFLGGVVGVAYFHSRTRKATARGQRLELSNPFELSQALKWGLIFAVVLFVVKLASELFGQSGIYLAGLLGGASDVDAITLSMANLHKTGSVGSKVAVTTIMLGAASNTVLKGTMAAVIGGWAFGRLVLGAFFVSLLGGALGVAALWLHA